MGCPILSQKQTVDLRYGRRGSLLGLSLCRHGAHNLPFPSFWERGGWSGRGEGGKASMSYMTEKGFIVSRSVPALAGWEVRNAKPTSEIFSLLIFFCFER